MRVLAFAVDLLLFPVRGLLWPFVLVDQWIIEKVNPWIRKHWRS